MEINPQIEKALKDREDLQEKIHLLKTELYQKQNILSELEGELKFANFQLQHWDNTKIRIKIKIQDRELITKILKIENNGK